jgi:hypothetical protein
MASFSSNYVAVPRCPVTFDVNFAAHMRIHIGGLFLGVLCGELSCPPPLVAPVSPVPPHHHHQFLLLMFFRLTELQPSLLRM